MGIKNGFGLEGSDGVASTCSGSWRNGQSTSLAARIEAAKRAGKVVQDVASVDAEDVLLASSDGQSGQDHA